MSVIEKPPPRVRSYFAICGSGINPDGITAALGVQPDHTSTESVDKSGFGFWEIHTKGLDTIALDEHVAHMVRLLENCSDALKVVWSTGGTAIELNLFVVVRWGSAGSAPHLLLRPEQSTFLGDHNINLVIDMN